MAETQEVAETSEIDEIVVPSTEEAEKVHQQHSTLAVEDSNDRARNAD